MPANEVTVTACCARDIRWQPVPHKQSLSHKHGMATYASQRILDTPVKATEIQRVQNIARRMNSALQPQIATRHCYMVRNTCLQMTLIMHILSVSGGSST